MDATYPLDYEDYLRTVESALRLHARESRVVLVRLTIDDLLAFPARTGLGRPEHSRAHASTPIPS
jgi:hypothetical protein